MILKCVCHACKMVMDSQCGFLPRLLNSNSAFLTNMFLDRLYIFPMLVFHALMGVNLRSTMPLAAIWLRVMGRGCKHVLLCLAAKLACWTLVGLTKGIYKHRYVYMDTLRHQRQMP